MGDRWHFYSLIDAFIEQAFETRRPIHLHMVLRTGYHELVGFQVFVKDHLAGLRTGHPKLFRNIALRRQEAANLRANNVVDPVHANSAPQEPCHTPTSPANFIPMALKRIWRSVEVFVRALTAIR